MPHFTYVSKDKQGLKLAGILEAEVIQEAIEILRDKDLTIISLKEHNIRKIKEKKVKLNDLAIFSRELSAMVDSGISLVKALKILGSQAKNKVLSRVSIEIKDDIEAGSSLYVSLAKHPKVFSPLYANMVKAGEASGFLDEVLDRLAVYLEKTSALQRKIRAALIYPIVVISMAIIITMILLLKVVPTFESIFKAMGGTLPLPTQILIMISTIARKFFFVWVGLIMAGFFAFKKYINTPEGRYWFDFKLLHLPIFGSLIQKVVIAKFTRTLATLVKSAVPILQALDIVSKTSGNKVVEQAINDSRQAIVEGRPISDPLSASGAFPPMVVDMIAIGEQTGQLQPMLSKIADLYEEQVDITVNGLTSMIEPLLIGFIGLMIGGIVIALFMPVFKVTELIH